MKTIAISLDNTICTPISHPLAEDEVLECKLRHNAIPEYIQDLKKQGYYIVIHASRNPVLWQATKEWLKKEDIIYDELKMGIHKYDILIDNEVEELQRLFPGKEGQKGR